MSDVPARWRSGALLALGVCAATLVGTGCGKRDDRAGSVGSGTRASGGSNAGPTLHGIAQLRGRPHLVEGTRRIALRFESEAFWYESADGQLIARHDVGREVARQLAELGGTAPDVLLGSGPIVAGGEHDHEQRLRVGPPANVIAIDGWPDQVAVLPDGIEVWRYEHAAHRQLAIVDARGQVTRPGVALDRIGPEVESASPVSARVCRHPQAIDLTGNGVVAVALVVECHGDAPVRLVTLRPAASVLVLPSRAALGFDPTAVAVDKAGGLAIAGSGRDGGIVVARVDATGRITPEPAPASAPGQPPPALAPAPAPSPGADQGAAAKPRGPVLVRDLELADDGARWTLAGDVVARNAQPVPLRAPDGSLLRPVTLAVDAQLGITVLAQARDESAWLFAERPLAGGAIAIPPR